MINIKTFLILPFAFSFVGCFATVQTDVTGLKKDIAQLQVKNSNLELRQADLYSKYEESSVAADTTDASIQELYKKMSRLSQEVKDLQITVRKQNKDAKNVPLPSEMYENAYNDFLLGKYEVSIVGFRSFLKQYKDHDLAVQAQYYIGESLYSQSDWSDAYEQYKKIEILYPNSEFVSSARLKMALCLELLGKKQDSLVILQSILVDYPKSAEAFTAKEKIKIYTNVKSK